MHKFSISQLYENIRKRRAVGKVAEKAGAHRNTVRNQFTGISPLEPSMVEAATEVLQELNEAEQEAQRQIEDMLQEVAPLSASENGLLT